MQDAPISTIDLTDREFKHYKMLQYKWTAEKKEYQKKKEALMNLQTKIQKTVKQELLVYTFKCDTAYNMLVRLKNRLAPTNIACEHEVLLEWQKLQKAERGRMLTIGSKSRTRSTRNAWRRIS